MFPIDVVDPWWTGVKHSGFNSAFLKVLHESFPEGRIYFYAEKHHLDSVESKLSGDSHWVSFRQIHVPYQDKKFKIPFLYLGSLMQSVRALMRFKGKGLLIFSGMNAVVMGLLYGINLVLRKKIVIIAHGELAFLDRHVARELNFHYKFQAFVFRKIFKRALASKHIYFVVLGEFIYRSLKEYIPTRLLEEKAIIMEHPYIFSWKSAHEKQKHTSKLHLATVGLATRAKGSNRIVNLQAALKQRNIDDMVELSIIGKVVDFQEELVDTGINYFSDTSFINQKQYDQWIDEQDFILFFYPNELYKLTASGAFLDCMLHDKPVIAIRNGFFSYYEKKMGSIGYLVDNIDDMAECIRECINRPDGGPTSKDFPGIEQMRRLFSPENVAVTLKAEFKKKYNQ